MQNKKAIVAALSAAVVLGTTMASSNAVANDAEKCYGVAKAGKNDCQTNTTSCAGTSTEDNQSDAWLFLPKGACERLVGGSLESS